jgi:hypothetical protein
MMNNDAAIISDSLKSELENGAKDDNDGYSTDDGSRVSEAKTETVILSKQETRHIVWSKALVALVITLAAFATSTGVYVLTKHSEDADFQVRVSTII